jgi:hypothetical protein
MASTLLRTISLISCSMSFCEVISIKIYKVINVKLINASLRMLSYQCGPPMIKAKQVTELL